MPLFTTIERLHKELKIEYLKEYVIKQVKSFYERCANSKYDLIRGLGQYEYDAKYARKRSSRRPKYFLYEN